MKTIEQIAQFFNDSEYFTGSVKINENLAKHTTMNVGGEAKLFLEPKDGESLVFAVRYFIEENVKFFVLGGGSNVIISDAGLDAVISTRKMNQVKFLTENTEHTESLIEGKKLLNPESPLCTPNLCIKFLTEGTEDTESLIEGEKLLNPESPLRSPNLCIKFLTENTEDTESLIEGEKLLNPESQISVRNLKKSCRFRLALPGAA